MNFFYTNPLWNSFKLIPRFTPQQIIEWTPSLDWVIKIADPRHIPQMSWLHRLMELAIIPTSMTIMLFALCCALIQEQRRATVGASDFTRILYSLLFHVGLLSAYSFFFGWIIDASQVLGDLFLDDAQISGFILTIYQQMKQWDFDGWLVAGSAYVSYVAAFIIFFCFFIARYMILALIYAVGPIIIAFSVWGETSRFRAWLVGLIQVASWVVVFKFIIAVSLSISLDRFYSISQTNIAFVIAANVLYVVMIWHTPAIASVLIGGVSLGFLGTQVVGISTQKTMELLKTIAETGKGTLKYLMQPGPSAPLNPAGVFNSMTLSFDQPPLNPYGGVFQGKTPYSASKGKTYMDAYGSGEPQNFGKDSSEPGYYMDPYGAGKDEFIKKSGKSWHTQPRHAKLYGDVYGTGKPHTPADDIGSGFHGDAFGAGKTENLRKKDDQ